MAVKLFRRNFLFSACYKLSKLAFSEKREYYFSEKVRNDLNLHHCSQVVLHTERCCRYSGSELFCANFQQGPSRFERNLDIQTATKLFCRRQPSTLVTIDPSGRMLDIHVVRVW